MGAANNNSVRRRVRLWAVSAVIVDLLVLVGLISIGHITDSQARSWVSVWVMLHAGSSRSSLAHLVSSLRSPRFRPNRRHWRPPWVDLFVFTEARRILKGQPCGHASANRVLPHLQKLSSAFICHQWQLLADCSQSVRIHAAASKLSGVLCANTRGG